MSCIICDRRPEQADVMSLCDSEENVSEGETDSVHENGVRSISERGDLVAESEEDDAGNNGSSDFTTGHEDLQGDQLDTEIGQSLEGKWQKQQVVAPCPTENRQAENVSKCVEKSELHAGYKMYSIMDISYHS